MRRIPRMQTGKESAARALLLRSGVTLAAYFAVMGVLWAVGIEGVYGHPTPFYALWAPALPHTLADAFYQLNALAVAGLFLYALARKLPKLLASETLLPLQRRRWLIFLVAFGIALPCAIAMLRGGLHGISQAYERSAYEFAGDIGKTSTIRDLFTNYLKVRPYLSMHAKVHPPGPIAFLWLLSYAVTPDPLALSFATIVVAALAVLPLFFWARLLLGEGTAVIASITYVCVPSVVLFNATSADALFPIVTLTCLFYFDRALRAPGIVSAFLYAAIAGFAYFLMTILKFSLVGLGAYFALAGLIALRDPAMRRNVLLTAVVMGASFLGFHLGLRAGTHFDIVAVFHAAKDQFDTDQANLDLETPRYPGWVYRFLNPMCWFYFAGIPVSLLFLAQLRRPAPNTRALFLVFFVTAVVLNFLYLARGEGERSALYLFPFLVLPAAYWLAGRARESGGGVVLAAAGFMAFQAWLTELLFYTYW